jgi:hypothetical protein
MQSTEASAGLKVNFVKIVRSKRYESTLWMSQTSKNTQKSRLSASGWARQERHAPGFQSKAYASQHLRLSAAGLIGSTNLFRDQREFSFGRR